MVELCEKLGYACYRGSLYDVLDRYYQAARQIRGQKSSCASPPIAR